MDNNGSKIEEYKMLREEMMYFMSKDTTLFTCLFTSVTAVLFFALEWKIPEGCLLAFLIIIPIGSKFAYHQKEMAKISAYMAHYLEKEISFKWETFLLKLSKHQKKPKTAKYLKFSECLMMGCGTLFSYIYLVWTEKIWEIHYRRFILETVILLILFIWTTVISKNIYKIKEYKKSYEKVMEDIEL